MNAYDIIIANSKESEKNMKRSKYDIVKIQTKNSALIWKEVRGIVDKKVTDKMDEAMLNWMVELTNCLSIWIDKGENMSNGELILARVNMGSLVESWLKFFYCVFYIDYLKNPKLKKQKIVEPNDMKFIELQEFSIGKLWNDDKELEYIWVNKIRDMRNAIHAFNYKDIGSGKDFIEDLEKYYKFVDQILSTFPPVEDFIQTFPQGYIMNVYFD